MVHRFGGRIVGGENILPLGGVASFIVYGVAIG
jgi:hypothetical protein